MIGIQRDAQTSSSSSPGLVANQRSVAEGDVPVLPLAQGRGAQPAPLGTLC